MLFDKNNFYLFLYLILILVTSKEKQVESVIFMKPFALSNFQDLKQGLQEIFQKFTEKIKLDEKRKQEYELETKRNLIFLKYLASKVSGSVLKDIYSRF